MLMKKNILLYMAAVAGLVLAGCNKESEVPQGSPLDMTVKASVGNLTRVAYDGASTTFQAGDQLAVWAWTGEPDVLPKSFVVNGEVNTLEESGAWVPANQMLWKNVQDKHYFMAVHPIPAAAIADLSAVPYQVDNANYEASDLLLATELTGLKAQAGTVDLVFSHPMAKLQVNLKFRNQFGPDGPAPESVAAALVGKGAAKVNYLTKVVTPIGDEAPVEMAHVAAATGYKMSFSGIQIPQEANKIVVTVGEHSFSYTHPEPLPILPGKVTTMGFIVGQDVILLEDVSVNDWIADEPLAGGEAERRLTINLAELESNYELKDGETLTGTLGANVKISIADGATVTLDGVTIKGANNSSYRWAGLNCVGDATIILKDGTTNTVKGFYENWPGILVPGGSTLTIQGETLGTGKLIASSNGYGCGIGGGWNIAGDSIGNINIEGGNITATGANGGAGIGGGNVQSCGAISITGGTITSTGGENGAGIGSGRGGSCVSINISGGTVTATGGANAAGIGGGGTTGNTDASCGDITITSGVTKVTAKKGSGAANSIGAGKGTCGTVTIGGVEGAITESPYVYPEPSPFDNLTAQDVGRVIGANGKIYNNATAASTASTTAVAIIAYVGSVGSVDASSETYKGLAIAMSDANSGSACTWASVKQNCLNSTAVSTLDPPVSDKNGISYTSTLTGDGHGHAHVAATVAVSNNGTAAPKGTSGWFLPSMGQWNLIVQGLATKKAGSAVTANLTNLSNDSYKATNLNSVITAAGGTGFISTADPVGLYWMSTENGQNSAWIINFYWGKEDSKDKTASWYVRSVLAF